MRSRSCSVFCLPPKRAMIQPNQPNTATSAPYWVVEDLSMLKAIDIKVELAKLSFLHNRGKDTTEAEKKAAFTTLAPYRDGGIFSGSFSGISQWERHEQGDEIVHILDGATTLTIMTDEGPQSFEMTA